MEYSGRSGRTGDQARRSDGKSRWAAAWLTLAGICLLASGCNSGPRQTQVPSASPVPGASPTAGASGPVAALGTVAAKVVGGSIPNFSHVFLIVFENKEYSTIAGSSRAPYLNSLAAQYALATQHYAIRHPSLPNYISLVAGSPFTIASDCTSCFLDKPNLADQVEASGRKWRAYMESMPQPCTVGNFTDTAGNTYAQKHDPFIYFDSIRKNPARCANIVPLTNFDADLASGAFNLMWISPNMCHSMHDCDVATGDQWLQTIVPKILDSAAFKKDGVLFIIFDEGTTVRGCCQFASGGRVFTIVASPLGKRGYQSTTAYDHYSILATIEDAWNMPRLENAGAKATETMQEFFARSLP